MHIRGKTLLMQVKGMSKLTVMHQDIPKTHYVHSQSHA